MVNFIIGNTPGNFANLSQNASWLNKNRLCPFPQLKLNHCHNCSINSNCSCTNDEDDSKRFKSFESYFKSALKTDK